VLKLSGGATTWVHAATQENGGTEKMKDETRKKGIQEWCRNPSVNGRKHKDTEVEVGIDGKEGLVRKTETKKKKNPTGGY